LEKEQILPEDNLLRRVQFLDPNFVKLDGTPASSSFMLKNGEDGLSVDIERLSSYEQSIQDPKRFRLFSLEAAHTVELGLTNEHDPIEGNYAHALIKGNISKGVARKLAAAARRINYPD
jgi:hypothetical protein